MTSWLRIAAAVLAILALPRLASAQGTAAGFPERRVTIILPYPGGGIVDIVARIVSDRMSEAWKQPIVVEPKPGANGNLAWDQVSRVAPDGYTWTFVSPGIIANPRMQPSLRWSERDFVPVGAIVWAPSVVVVNPSLPVKSMAEFVAYAKAHAGTLNWANPGVGTSQHLNTAILINDTKIAMTEVAYKGQPPAIIDLMANRVQLAVSSIGLVSAHIKSGALRALAVLGKSRSPLLPDVPTMAEAGYPDVNVVAWYGFAAPKDTPPAIVDKIVAGINAATAETKVRALLEGQGLQVVEPMSAADLDQLMAADVKAYTKVINDAKIRIGN